MGALGGSIEEFAEATAAELYGIKRSLEKKTSMSRRDQFAMSALQGLLASDEDMPLREFAEKAYRMADMMLVQRSSDSNE